MTKRGYITNNGFMMVLRTRIRGLSIRLKNDPTKLVWRKMIPKCYEEPIYIYVR